MPFIMPNQGRSPGNRQENPVLSVQKLQKVLKLVVPRLWATSK